MAGKRKREVGLVIPSSYSFYTKSKKSAKILDEQLKKRKEMVTYFELTHEVEKEHAKPSFYSLNQQERILPLNA